ncbi:hypothetical protein GQ42DRAFT_168996 [Ramicandelaber brevisporus]|nr:hypothetical protein GQ42DRAFT_168996 [Ramicandelaber brevisporus]
MRFSAITFITAALAAYAIAAPSQPQPSPSANPSVSSPSTSEPHPNALESPIFTNDSPISTAAPAPAPAPAAALAPRSHSFTWLPAKASFLSSAAPALADSTADPANPMAAKFPIPNWSELISIGGPRGLAIEESWKTSYFPIHFWNGYHIKFQVQRPFQGHIPAYFIVAYRYGVPVRILEVIDARELNGYGETSRDIVLNMNPALHASMNIQHVVVVAPLCNVEDLGKPWNYFVWDYSPTKQISIGIN